MQELMREGVAREVAIFPCRLTTLTGIKAMRSGYLAQELDSQLPLMSAEDSRPCEVGVGSITGSPGRHTERSKDASQRQKEKA